MWFSRMTGAVPVGVLCIVVEAEQLGCMAVAVLPMAGGICGLAMMEVAAVDMTPSQICC
jgi:hypothetical protein